MKRAWVGIALLSCSWLWGLYYYRPANGWLWAAAVLGGVLGLRGLPLRLPSRPQAGLAVLVLLPVIWWTAWPYRAAPLGVAAGLGLGLLPIPGGRPRPASQGLAAAGLVLLVQGLVLWAYQSLTARSHELPWPLPEALHALAALLGIDAAVSGSTLAIYTLREVHRLGATWELVLDPATLGFAAGGVTLLGCLGLLRPARNGLFGRWLRAVGTLGLLMLAWLPLRAALMIGVLLHRAVRAGDAVRLNLMDQFFSPWLHLGLLVGPVLLASRFVPVPDTDLPEAEPPTGVFKPARARLGYAGSLVLIFLGVAVLAFWFFWEPAGRRAQGRVKFVERHSEWALTTTPYDTRSLNEFDTRTGGKKGAYDYGAIYEYSAQFYRMSRLLESDPINEQALSDCDVLVIKTPTQPYSAAEIEAVHRFVRRGGGLLLIGEHTDYEKSSSFMNRIAAPFGFKFRHDLLFAIGKPYVQWYEPPRVPHPVVQHVPRMAFAVSCSIDPGRSFGQAVIRSSGLWSLPPNYRSANWFPEAEYRTDMRYGAFIQLWATWYGRGRVLAWTDSTIFSSFCAFQPGKAELMLGMLEWLNRRSLLDQLWARRALASAVAVVVLGLLVAGIYLGYSTRVCALVLLGAGWLGWTAGSGAAAWNHRLAMPPPVPIQPKFQVIIDRTVSDVPLALGAYNEQQDGTGYGLLEQWIARLGYVTARRSGPAALAGDMLVVICPRKSVTDQFRQGLVNYVEQGGKLLVIDSPYSAGSTANSLLWPLGLGVSHARSREGKLVVSGDWPGIEASLACEISGGTPLAWVDGLPVAATASFGHGSVMAIGFGSELNDAGLGYTWMAQPDPEAMIRSDLLFAMVRHLATGEPISPPQGKPAPE